jgi:hypothetical protein
VVYLRGLYYPDGLFFPLRELRSNHLVVEIVRETATILMLAAVGMIAGKKSWEKFGYFIFLFGVWDIFYYVWLKVVLEWPTSLLDSDVLFLIPFPWIGPVIAPLLLASLMTLLGPIIVDRLHRGTIFRPGLLSWILSLAATLLLIGSFAADTAVTTPPPYDFRLLVLGIALYGAGFFLACRRSDTA